MADYIDRDVLRSNLKKGWKYYDTNTAILIDSLIDCLPSVDAVEIVRCKDCVYWQDAKVLTENGEFRDYLPDEKPFVTIDKGINVGAHCTLHGFEDMSGSWFWAQANDFCSKGVKKNE